MKFLLSFALALGIVASATSQDWQTNLDQSRSIATKQNKNIVLVFSGSDWCGPCIKLEKNIWSSVEFKKAASENWVLLKADFPRKKANRLSNEQTKENEMLAEKYNSSGYFPLVVVLDPSGKALGTTSYKDFTPAEYINHLQSFE